MTSGTVESMFALKPHPRVDGDEILWVANLNKPKELIVPHVFDGDFMSADDLKEPAVTVAFSARFTLVPEPRIDEQAFSHRLRLDSLDYDGLGPWPLGFSLIWHVLFAGMIIGFMQFSELENPFDQNPTEVIEVAFGLSPDMARALPDGKTAAALEEAQALKTIQQLPQLPKSLALDSATPPVEDTALAQPKSDVKEVVATPTPAPTPVQTPKTAATPTPGPVVEQSDPTAAKKMKLEELAKRLEKEQRAVGEKERAGTDKKTASDTFRRPKEIPINPLGRDIPKAPSMLGQAGSLQGKVGVQIRNEYAMAAAMHMRKHWSLPDVMQFEPKLEVVLGFEINGLGKILGRVRVVKASGNALFDSEAMKALESAGPFPDLPKEMGQKLSLRMKFSPGSINF